MFSLIVHFKALLDAKLVFVFLSLSLSLLCTEETLYFFFLVISICLQSNCMYGG